MQDSTALPDLRVLPAEQIIPHEEVDPRRVDPLAGRLQAERRLKNPPVVAAVPDSDLYVVLDGANRSLALKQLGASHITALVIFPQLRPVDILNAARMAPGNQAAVAQGMADGAYGFQRHPFLR